MSESLIEQILVAVISGTVPAIAIVAGMRAQLSALKEYVHELKDDLHDRVNQHESVHHAPHCRH